MANSRGAISRSKPTLSSYTVEKLLKNEVGSGAAEKCVHKARKVCLCVEGENPGWGRVLMGVYGAAGWGLCVGGG